MASRAKKVRYTAEEVLIVHMENEFDSDRGGMSSGEESDIDRQLINFAEEMSDEEQFPDAGDDAGGDEDDANYGAADNDDDYDAFNLAGNTSVCTQTTFNYDSAGDDDEDDANYGAADNDDDAFDYDSADAGDDEDDSYVPNVGRASGSGQGWGRGRGPGQGRGLDQAAGVTWKSYWDPDVGNEIPAFKPTRPVGVHFGQPFLRNTMTTATEFFHLFFSVEMLTNICTHTNSYAYTHIAAGTHNSYSKADGSWQETTPEEIDRLIALLLYFGLVKVSTHASYWSTKSLYHGLWARPILPRNRFTALMAFLHVVDPNVETPGDKLRNVDSFITYFKSRCLSLYQPKLNIAIDERMVKSRHRSGIRQYIRDKPTKWGVKLWVLADSSNGYTIDFNVYIGENAVGIVSEHGLGYDVVMKLIQPFLHQGYHLFFDNFYTSVALVKDLFDLGVLATGTTSERRREFPENLKNGKQWAKKLERGSMRWERDPPCLALQWVDSKVVSVVTSIDNANDKVSAIRKSKTGGVWKDITVNQPKAIDRYNKYMNGVDRSDQLIGTNNVMRKCLRWWKTLFFHLIDIAIVNGFILFREHQANFPDDEALQRPKDYSVRNFREEVIRQICGFPEYADPPICQSKPTPPPPPPPTSVFSSIHLPAFSDSRKRCFVCHQQGRGELRVHSYCSAPQCGKYLHVTKEKNCFMEWHNSAYHDKLLT